MTEVGVPEKGDTLDIKRMSFALSTDPILKMRPTDELADAPLDAARFIRAHGLLD